MSLVFETRWLGSIERERERRVLIFVFSSSFVCYSVGPSLASAPFLPIPLMKANHRRPPALNLNPWGSSSPKPTPTNLPSLATSSPTASLHPSSISSPISISTSNDNRRSFLGDLSALPSPSYSRTAAQGSYSSHRTTTNDDDNLRSPSPSSPGFAPPLRSARSLSPRSGSPSVYSSVLANSTPDLPTQNNNASPSQSNPYPSQTRSPSSLSASKSHSHSASNLPTFPNPLGPPAKTTSPPLQSSNRLPPPLSPGLGPSFFDLDPTLPITNTLPPLPRSASASIKLFFSRSPKKPHHAQLALLSSSHEQKREREERLNRSKSGIVAIPVSAFESSEVQVGGRGRGDGGGKERGSGVEAWRNGNEMDPRVLKMEGMVSMHLELEKERMRRIAGGGGGGEGGRRRT